MNYACIENEYAHKNKQTSSFAMNRTWWCNSSIYIDNFIDIIQRFIIQFVMPSLWIALSCTLIFDQRSFLTQIIKQNHLRMCDEKRIHHMATSKQYCSGDAQIGSIILHHSSNHFGRRQHIEALPMANRRCHGRRANTSTPNVQPTATIPWRCGQ